MKYLPGIIIFITVLSSALFCQTVQIGFWTEYVDTVGEFRNMIAALDSGGIDYELHKYRSYTAITAESLDLINVFIVPECERDPTGTIGTTAGTYLGPIMRPWVERGGLLLCFFNHGADFLTAAGFDRIAGRYLYCYWEEVVVIAPTDPLAEGVEPRFYGMNASYAYPDYSSYTVVVSYFDWDIADTAIFVGYQAFGSGHVVFYGWDYYDFNTPNEDRLFVNAINLWAITSEGPILRSFFPAEGAFVSADTSIIMVFSDEDGIALSSFRANINGHVVSGTDPEVSIRGDSIFIRIPPWFIDGSIQVSIENIEDALGHRGPDTTRVFIFNIDRTPPVITYREPEGVLSYAPDGLMIRYYDFGSGTGRSRWYLYYPGLDTIRNGMPGVICEGDSVVLIAFYLARITFEPNETTWLEIGVWDNPTVGAPNKRVYRWWFISATGITEKHLPDDPKLDVTPNPFNSSVRIGIQNSEYRIQNTEYRIQNIDIYDIAGKKVFSFSDADVVRSRSNREFIWTPEPSLPSGVYLVRARLGKLTDAKIEEKRILYLK